MRVHSDNGAIDFWDLTKSKGICGIGGPFRIFVHPLHGDHFTPLQHVMWVAHLGAALLTFEPGAGPTQFRQQDTSFGAVLHANMGSLFVSSQYDGQ